MSESVENTTENTQTATPEMQIAELTKIAEMKHKSFSQLLGLHIDGFSAIMVNGNGTSYAKKIQAAQALKEAITFALDFGLDISKSKIRQGGNLSKEVNSLAGIMVQALDNRMLLIANRMSQLEKAENEKVNNEGDTNELEK